MMGLTPRMREVLSLIARRIAERGEAPTIGEMQVAIKLSRSRIFHLLCALEERGHIRRLPHKARAIEIVAPSVTLNAEILTLTDRYAALHKISRDTAANELLRIALGAAA